MTDIPKSSVTNLLSALAVALSLVFVGFEIRQNTVAQQSATMEGIFGQRTDFNLAVLTDDVMIGLLRRLREGATTADLTTDEVQKARTWLVTYMRIFESAHRQVGLGVLDRREVLNTFESLRTIASYPFVSEQWPTLQGNFAPDFVAYLEREFLS